MRELASKLVLLEPKLTKAKAREQVDNWLSSGDPDDTKKLDELRAAAVPDAPKTETKVTMLFEQPAPEKTSGNGIDDGPK